MHVFESLLDDGRLAREAASALWASGVAVRGAQGALFAAFESECCGEEAVVFGVVEILAQAVRGEQFVLHLFTLERL